GVRRTNVGSDSSDGLRMARGGYEISSRPAAWPGKNSHSELPDRSPKGAGGLRHRTSSLVTDEFRPYRRSGQDLYGSLPAGRGPRRPPACKRLRTGTNRLPDQLASALRSRGRKRGRSERKTGHPAP